MFQFILFFLCHPNWDIRKAAEGTIKKILAVTPQLAESVVHEFLSYVSVVEEKATLLKTRWIYSCYCQLSVFFFRLIFSPSIVRRTTIWNWIVHIWHVYIHAWLREFFLVCLINLLLANHLPFLEWNIMEFLFIFSLPRSFFV